MRRSCRSTDFDEHKIPAGSSAKWRGSLPPVGTPPIWVNLPLFLSIAKNGNAVQSPVGDVEKFSLGCTAISATSLRPENSGGSVDKLLICFSVPFFASKEKLVAVEDSSLTTNRNFPFGETPRGAVPSRFQVCRRRQVRRQRSLRGIKLENQNFIETPDPPRARNDCPRWFNPMRVRTFLRSLFGPSVPLS